MHTEAWQEQGAHIVTGENRGEHGSAPPHVRELYDKLLGFKAAEQKVRCVCWDCL